MLDSELVSDGVVIDGIPLAEYCIYVGPHVITGCGWQFAFDFGGAWATLYFAPGSHGVELMAYGRQKLQLENLSLDSAIEALKGLVKV